MWYLGSPTGILYGKALGPDIHRTASGLFDVRYIYFLLKYLIQAKNEVKVKNKVA